MSNTSIAIPVAVANVANAPTVDLSNYGPKRTFGYTGPSGAIAKIYASVDGVNFPPITANPLVSLGANQDPITLDDLSLRYRAVPSAVGTSCDVVVEPSAPGSGGSAFLNTTVVPNKATGGVIGTAAATVDAFEVAQVAQTTVGQTLTLPAPTDLSASRRFYIENAGTTGFTLLGQFIIPGSALEAQWTGTAWIPATGAVSDGSKIAIGGAVNGFVTIFGDGTGGLAILESGAATIDIMTAAGAILIDSTSGAILIGTGATAKPITIGNGAGATAVGIQAGTGGVGIAAVGVGGITLTADTAPIALVGGPAGVLVGANAADHPVIVGSTTGGANTTIQAGSAAGLGLRLVNNGVTWVWPTADGAAGTKLTTNGAGILSFT